MSNNKEKQNCTGNSPSSNVGRLRNFFSSLGDRRSNSHIMGQRTSQGTAFTCNYSNVFDNKSGNHLNTMAQVIVEVKHDTVLNLDNLC